MYLLNLKWKKNCEEWKSVSKSVEPRYFVTNLTGSWVSNSIIVPCLRTRDFKNLPFTSNLQLSPFKSTLIQSRHTPFPHICASTLRLLYTWLFCFIFLQSLILIHFFLFFFEIPINHKICTAWTINFKNFA